MYDAQFGNRTHHFGCHVIGYSPTLHRNHDQVGTKRCEFRTTCHQNFYQHYASINIDIHILRYTQERQAFGKAIGEFGQIQQMIATSYAEYMAGILLDRFPSLCLHVKLKIFNNYQADPMYIMWRLT